MILLNFFVNRYFSQYRVEFFHFQTLGCIFLVLGSNVTRHAGQSAFLMLGAL